jgi:hypothetical protein
MDEIIISSHALNVHDGIDVNRHASLSGIEDEDRIDEMII